jgi:dienelactone hydrolase
MKGFLWLVGILAVNASLAQDFTSDSLDLKTAKGHPIQYYISLPQHYSREKKWPIVVVLEAAEKEYRQNALRFVRARLNKPFILVAPFNVNNSRSGRRDPRIFPYSAETWDLIEKEGDCKFMMDGLTRIISDVQNEYNGADKYFITGFEAGAHTVWQMTFQHPERLLASAPVEGNYNQNSCTEEGLFSTHASRAQLPVKGFYGEKDTLFGAGGKVFYQWENAKKQGMAHGFKNFTVKAVKGKAHEPMPAEVLDWFYELWTRK